jgi:hypothetical protein
MVYIIFSLLILTLVYLMFPIYFRYYLAKIILLPLYIEIYVRAKYTQRLADKNSLYIKDMTFTPYFARLLKNEAVFYELLETYQHSFSNLLGVNDMSVVLRKLKVHKYSPLASRVSDDGVVFMMRDLTKREMSRIKDGLVGISSKGKFDKLKTSTVKLEITLARLSDWSGIVDENGNTVAFSEDLKESLYDMLPKDLQDELEAVFGDGDSDLDAYSKLKAEVDQQNAELEESDS